MDLYSILKNILKQKIDNELKFAIRKLVSLTCRSGIVIFFITLLQKKSDIPFMVLDFPNLFETNEKL